MSEDCHPSRRTVLAGAGAAGAVGCLASPQPLLAAAPVALATKGPSVPLTDPRNKYRSEPFPEQRQPWPALASLMNPPPDHGERSYKGSDRLTGRKAVITGGDSGIGRAAAIAYAREGADVAINYYPTGEPDARQVVDLIRQAGRKAVATPGDLRGRESA